MDFVSHSKIPVINMNNLQPGTESWVVTRHKVRQTLEEYGCFLAIYGPGSQQLQKEAFDCFKPLFDFPKETKSKNTYADDPLAGYLSPSLTRPLCEAFGIKDVTSSDAIQNFTHLMWPEGNDHFSKVMRSYANLVSELDNLVRKMVFESYGVEKHYESHNELMTKLLKVNKYRPAKTDEKNIATVIHTDKNLLTIISQNHVTGLEAEINGEWVAVSFLPSSFFVSSGDTFMAWSNGRMKALHHRVVMNGQEYRYSMALFTLQKGIMETPDELIDEDNQRKFKPFDHYKFQDFYYKGGGQGYVDERVIKLYCGV